MALRRQLCVCAVAALIAPARAFVPGTPSRRPALSPLRLIEGHAASMAARMPTKGHAASRCTRMAAGGGGDDGDAAAAEEAPKVLAYRASLGVAALAITTAAVASILSSEGMPIAGTVADDATAAALLASALSIVLCSWASFDLPLLGWPVGGATFRAACFVPLAALGGVHDLHQAAPALAFATALLAGREAYYYGRQGIQRHRRHHHRRRCHRYRHRHAATATPRPPRRDRPTRPPAHQRDRRGNRPTRPRARPSPHRARQASSTRLRRLWRS